ncbi:MAG TPA: HAMP domain-containing protein, partial [Bacillota bacterium]|nr:HAMP domain-containing protein [Bacillota bacterium]
MGIKDIIDRLRLPRLPQNLKFGFRIKFRVFHKILGILAIMVLLIALQGYLNLQNIDQMQAISGRVFLESNMSLVSMMEAKQNINNFRRDNAMFLAGLVPIGPDHYTFVMNISDLKISAAAKSDLNQISEMLKQPLQKEQFSQLNQHLIAIESEVDRLLEQARSKSITSMNLGHQFSKNSKQTTLVFLLISCAVAVGLGLLVAASISRPLKKTVLMIQEMTRGHLEMRLKIKSKDEIGMMAQSMDRFADDLQTKVIGTMSRIAAGDLTAEVVAQDEQDEIGPALRTTIEALRGLVDDVNMLSQAAIEGRYDLRADAGG